MKHKKTVTVAAGALMALGMAGQAAADSGAEAAAVGSSGVLAGNVAQVPLHIPVNACGNALSAIGALNPAFGSACAH